MPFSLALSEVGLLPAGRVSPVVFVFKGTLAYLSYNGAGNAGYIKIENYARTPSSFVVCLLKTAYKCSNLTFKVSSSYEFRL